MSAELEQGFRDFHGANPHVYVRLVELARQLRERGHRRVGMKMLFEVLRWEHALRTTGDDFRLNNNYTAYYARLVMEREPDLDGIFETRELRTGRGRWILGPAPSTPSFEQEALPV